MILPVDFQSRRLLATTILQSEGRAWVELPDGAVVAWDEDQPAGLTAEDAVRDALRDHEVGRFYAKSR